MHKNSSSGFAIGAILLAVVLIAAIVAAISAGSSGSNSVSEREKDRLQASALLSQIVQLEQTVAIVRSQTNLPIEAISDDDDCSSGPGDCFPLFDPAQGMSEPKVPVQALTTGASSAWVYRDDVEVTNAGVDLGTSSNEVLVLVDHLTDTVCRQINNLANGIAITDTQILSTDFTLPTESPLAFTSATYYPKGCVLGGGQGGTNFAYSVIVVN